MNRNQKTSFLINIPFLLVTVPTLLATISFVLLSIISPDTTAPMVDHKEKFMLIDLPLLLIYFTSFFTLYWVLNKADRKEKSVKWLRHLFSIPFLINTYLLISETIKGFNIQSQDPASQAGLGIFILWGFLLPITGVMLVYYLVILYTINKRLKGE
ncbi:MAG TPA: hypothetical protein PLV59_03610 [Candidatus Dojkabacteria bacterium]|nr:hypothetical protein [Candidatus Dojkabacteria bacterium]